MLLHKLQHFFSTHEIYDFKASFYYLGKKGDFQEFCPEQLFYIMK